MNPIAVLKSHLHQAVKQCQMQFGAKKELATSDINCVLMLCNAWENVFLHGLKKKGKPFIGIKQIAQFTEMAGIGHLFANEADNQLLSFWPVIKEQLTYDERERFLKLSSIRTDIGRSRAWLRAALNEHTLEQSVIRILEDKNLLEEHYENSAFVRDEEESSVLSNLAAGVDSILFAFELDVNDLNIPAKSVEEFITSLWQERDMLAPEITPSLSVQSGSNSQIPASAIQSSITPNTLPKKLIRRRKPVNKVSFDDDDSTTHSDVSSVPSPFLPTISSCNSDNRRFKFDNPTLSFDNQSIHSDSAAPVLTESSHASHQEFQRVHKRVASENALLVSTNSDGSGAHLNRELKLVSSSNNRHSIPAGQKISISSTSNVSMSTPSLRPQSSSDSYDAGVELTEDGSMSRGSSFSFDMPLADGATPFNFLQDEFSTLVERTQGDGGSYGHLEFKTIDPQDCDVSVAPGRATNLNPKHPPLVVNRRSEPTLSDESSSLQVSELKSALLSMIDKKDTISLENKHLIALLDDEKTKVAALEDALADTKSTFLARQEKDNSIIQGLRRENELLKHQLKKYVSAVQHLKPSTSESTPEARLSQHEADQVTRSQTRWKEAEVYESRLSELAEMHADLLEVNERLHKESVGKDAKINRLQNNLVDLRGPLAVADSVETTSTETNSLGEQSDSGQDVADTYQSSVNLWIPSTFLKGSGKLAYHIYQVYVRVGEEDWNVYRRFSEFHSLHMNLRHSLPKVDQLIFPNKHLLGNRDQKTVEERRIRLQSYLRHLVAIVLAQENKLHQSVTKPEIMRMIPFLAV